jgi:hypothetical protein
MRLSINAFLLWTFVALLDLVRTSRMWPKQLLHLGVGEGRVKLAVEGKRDDILSASNVW